MADEAGQTEAAAAATPEAAPSAAEPFFSHGESSWATKEDLTAHLDSERETGRRERLNMRDYATRLEQIKARTDKHDAAVKQFREEQQKFAPSRARAERLDQVMRQRPDVAQYIKQLLGEAPSAAAVSEREGTAREALRAEIMAEMQPVIDAHKERELSDKHEAMLAEVFGDESMPHGTDQDKVREELERISDSPDIGREVALLVARQYAHAEAQDGAQPVAKTTTVPRKLPARAGKPLPKADDSAKYKGKTFAEIEAIQLAELAS